MNEFVFTSRHTGDTPFKCDICKKSFTRKEHYVNHYMWHTGDYILQIVKSSAGKIIIYSFVYFYLIGETPHTCNVCGKKYTRKGMLLHKLWQIHIWDCSLWPIAYLRLFFFGVTQISCIWITTILWKKKYFLICRALGKSSTRSFRRKSIPVRNMWQVLFTQGTLYQSHIVVSEYT